MSQALFGIAMLVAPCGCGGDDDEEGGGDSVGNYGTCDRKATAFRCIESTGEPINIRNQREGCLDQGGSWSTEPCPNEDVVVCCDYEFGLQFRECSYQGTALDLEAACTPMFGDGCVCTPGM